MVPKERAGSLTAAILTRRGTGAGLGTQLPAVEQGRYQLTQRGQRSLALIGSQPIGLRAGQQREHPHLAFWLSSTCSERPDLSA
jgi:hypothetical protein